MDRLVLTVPDVNETCALTYRGGFWLHGNWSDVSSLHGGWPDGGALDMWPSEVKCYGES